MTTKALPQAGQAATEAPAQQYMTRAHWDKLTGYIKQLAASHNALESKVEALTTCSSERLRDWIEIDDLNAIFR